MLNWLFGKRDTKVAEDIKQSFSAVKKDMDSVGNWIKHLDGADKQLFKAVQEIKHELSSIKEDMMHLREQMQTPVEVETTKQVFEKTGVLSKQTAVLVDEEGVQTTVQTGSFYDIFKGLSAQERAILFTIMNSEMKLSYEDLALLLGKEKSTVRGQVNAIKQKKEGLIEEISEKNGKKRVFVPEEIKEKLAKYAKVRLRKPEVFEALKDQRSLTVGKKKKVRINVEKEEMA